MVIVNERRRSYDGAARVPAEQPSYRDTFYISALGSEEIVRVAVEPLRAELPKFINEQKESK
jgi:hypothetical protein